MEGETSNDLSEIWKEHKHNYSWTRLQRNEMRYPYHSVSDSVSIEILGSRLLSHIKQSRSLSHNSINIRKHAIRTLRTRKIKKIAPIATENDQNEKLLLFDRNEKWYVFRDFPDIIILVLEYSAVACYLWSSVVIAQRLAVIAKKYHNSKVHDQGCSEHPKTWKSAQ